MGCCAVLSLGTPFAGASLQASRLLLPPVLSGLLPAAAAAAGVWLGWCCRCLVLSRFVPAVMHCPEGTPAELAGSARGPLRLALALVASRPSRLCGAIHSAVLDGRHSAQRRDHFRRMQLKSQLLQ